jgi:hypothetical protein
MSLRINCQGILALGLSSVYLLSCDDLTPMVDAEIDTACFGKENFTPCHLVTEPDRSYDICMDDRCVSPGCGKAYCNVPGPYFTLPDPIEKNAFRFERGASVDSPPEKPTVLDHVTGLIWQGCPSGRTGKDCEYENCEEKEYNWNDALEYCENLNWAKGKWRLPSRYALESIIDNGRYKPAIDTEAFPETPSGCFWSSSTYALDPSDKAWNVDFINGEEKHGLKTKNPKQCYVRCVKDSSRSTVDQRFTRHDEENQYARLIEDKVTGLFWHDCNAGECLFSDETEVTWTGAVKYCDELFQWGKYKNWRLPNRRELLSLIDDRKTGPIIDTRFFPEMGEGDFWSSSEDKSDDTSAWYVSFMNGQVDVDPKVRKKFVRCVL